MKTQHTPGPWHVNKQRDNSIEVHDPDGMPVAVMTYLRSQWQPNARLIAAAPELLAALEQALSWLTSYPGDGALAAYGQARAAISKATA